MGNEDDKSVVTFIGANENKHELFQPRSLMQIRSIESILGKGPSKTDPVANENPRRDWYPGRKVRRVDALVDGISRLIAIIKQKRSPLVLIEAPRMQRWRSETGRRFPY